MVKEDNKKKKNVENSIKSKESAKRKKVPEKPKEELKEEKKSDQRLNDLINTTSNILFDKEFKDLNFDEASEVFYKCAKNKRFFEINKNLKPFGPLKFGIGGLPLNYIPFAYTLSEWGSTPKKLGNGQFAWKVALGKPISKIDRKSVVSFDTGLRLNTLPKHCFEIHQNDEFVEKFGYYVVNTGLVADANKNIVLQLAPLSSETKPSPKTTDFAALITLRPKIYGYDVYLKNSQ